jgi:hypothetical protein
MFRAVASPFGDALAKTRLRRTVRRSSFFAIAASTLAIAVAIVTRASNASAAAREHNYRDYAPGTGPSSSSTNVPLEDQRIVIALDAMVGFGSSTVGEPANSAHATPITVLADHTAYVESFIATLRVDIAKHWIVKAWMPFTYMSFEATTGRRLGAAALGNAAFEVDHRFFSNDVVDQWAMLTVHLPTAQGTPPPTVGELDASWQNTANRFFANRAAIGVRGGEMVAPFAYDRWSIVPRYTVTSPPRRPGWTYEGTIALENMFDTSGEADAKYAARFSGWLRGGWAFDDVTDLGVRLAYGVPLHGTGEDKPSTAIEPQLRFTGSRLTAVLGILVPISGVGTDPRFTSVHAGFSARF